MSRRATPPVSDSTVTVSVSLVTPLQSVLRLPLTGEEKQYRRGNPSHPHPLGAVVNVPFKPLRQQGVDEHIKLIVVFLFFFKSCIKTTRENVFIV